MKSRVGLTMDRHEDAKTRKRIFLRAFVLSWLATSPLPALAQVTRLAVLQAEDRRAPTANDLAVLRSGAHSGDPQTMRLGIRALGRLQRPSLIAEITPFLRHTLSEIRAE